MMNKKDFSVILRRLRNKLLMTQTDMSARAGIPLPTYKLWELAEVLPSPKNMKKLVDFLEAQKTIQHLELKELHDCYNTIRSKKAERDIISQKKPDTRFIRK